jgi:hypothetical protein
MAEQTFRSPGFFENEIDLASPRVANLGTPAGVIGTAEHGPAFVPVTVGSFSDFETKFGTLDPERFGPYAVREFLKHRSAVTYMRVLGAGANSTTAHVAATTTSGVVNNAGFQLAPNSTAKDAKGRTPGSVQFICARHTVPAASDIGFPVFTDNDSFPGVRDLGTVASTVFTFTGTSLAGTTVTVIDAAGTSVAYTAAAANNFAASPPQFEAQTDATTSAANLQQAIEGFTGHNGTLSTKVAAGVLTITQTVTGSAGNTAITGSLGSWSSAAAAFTGGTDTTTALADTISLVRGMLFTTTGSQILVMNTSETAPASPDSVADDLATPAGEGKRFKIGVYAADIENDSSGDTGDALFGTDDGRDGWRVYTASLDPNDPYYISKVLNTDPNAFQREKHLLWADYSVEEELASISTSANSVALLSGSAGAPDSGLSTNNTFDYVFGRFDARYRAPRTTEFISQPYGSEEYPLFHFEAISDGAWANEKIKISIADLKASNDPNYLYPTFEVQIRKFDDEDFGPQMLERYPGCTLDPASDRFIARQIGDMRVRYDFDSIDEDERRLVLSGKYPNRSQWVRVRMNVLVDRGEVPKDAMPFGFKGIPALKTGVNNKDPNSYGANSISSLGTVRLYGNGDAGNLSGSIVPPLPYRFKVTKGAVNQTTTPEFIGEPGTKERADAKFYWGVKFDRIKSGSTNVYNANIGGGMNQLVRTYTKLQGIPKCDVMTQFDATESDTYHNHKFTLARVALRQELTATGEIDTSGRLTGSAGEHMKEAVYLRNATPDSRTGTVRDPVLKAERISFATLVNSSSLLFNRFTAYTKFTNIFFGGFDGLNILDEDNYYMNDKAASTENASGGKAGDSHTGGLGLTGTNDGTMSGAGKANNIVASYRKGVEIMTDPMTVRTNILCIPGIRDPYVTDFAADENKQYGMSLYLMDIPSYDEDGTRRWIGDSVAPSAQRTAEEFTRRSIDNNYAATYFPDVSITDPVNGGRRVFVPASVAAIGALAFNDNVSYPWFAPAGFNRGALGFVNNVKSRLTSGDRDELYDARINPIATFPDGGFVIFGQKTLQMAQSALDRVNVRRLMLELKRQVMGIADKMLFEMNNSATRSRFINLVSPRLALIQSQAGIESFRVVMDDTNNTPRDVEENRLNGKIVVVPTRAIEFIAIDFIITNSGVSFE